MTAWVTQKLMRVGSTRSVSILRILLVLITWSRWANEVLPFRNLTPERLALSVAFFATTCLMLIGYKSRLSTLAVGLVTATMIWGFDAGWFSHHTRVISIAILLLALTPCGGSYSLDRWLAVRRALQAGTEPPPEEGPTWGRINIGVFAGAVYFWSGADKLAPQFISGERLEQMAMYAYLGSDFPEGWLFPLIAQVSAVIVTIVWLVMPVILWIRKIQWISLPLGLFFHAVIYYTLPVGPFTVTMWAIYLVYLDPDAFHRFLDQLQGYPRKQVSEDSRRDGT